MNMRKVPEMHIGDKFEKKARNPFLGKETWAIVDKKFDNIGNLWYELNQLEDTRNYLTISSKELYENFIICQH